MSALRILTIGSRFVTVTRGSGSLATVPITRYRKLCAYLGRMHRYADQDPALGPVIQIAIKSEVQERDRIVKQWPLLRAVRSAVWYCTGSRMPDQDQDLGVRMIHFKKD